MKQANHQAADLIGRLVFFAPGHLVLPTSLVKKNRAVLLTVDLHQKFAERNWEKEGDGEERQALGEAMLDAQEPSA